MRLNVTDTSLDCCMTETERNVTGLVPRRLLLVFLMYNTYSLSREKRLLPTSCSPVYRPHVSEWLTLVEFT